MAEPIRYSDLVKPDSSITDLIKQLDELSDAYANTQKTIRGEALTVAATLERVSGATEEGRRVTRKASDDAERLARAQRDLAFAESETAQEIARLKAAQAEQNRINKLTAQLNEAQEGSYRRLSAQYSLNCIYLNNMSKYERENTEEGRKLEQQTRELYEEMKRLQEATGKHQLNVGNYEDAGKAMGVYADRLRDALGLNSQFGQTLTALAGNTSTVTGFFTGIANGVKALGATLSGLMANPVFLAIAGITAAGAAFKWWYDYNAGLVEATRLTQQFTGLADEELRKMRTDVTAVAEAFGADFRETLEAVNTLSRQYGISSQEALGLIQDGFVAGADASGDFLNQVKEYPAYFKEAGIDAEAFVAIIAQTVKSGIFSDKGVDAIKEANLRIREMTTATQAALEGIGISSDEVQRGLQDGSLTTFDVMQQVSAKLAEFPESSAAVGTAIADIFGGPGEDAGLQYLLTLKDIQTDLDVVKGQTGELGSLQEDVLESEKAYQEALSEAFDATGGSFEWLTSMGKIFINNVLAAIVKIIDTAIRNVRSWGVAFEWAFGTAYDIGSALVSNLGAAFKSLGEIIRGALSLDPNAIKAGYRELTSSYGKFAKQVEADVKKRNRTAVADLKKIYSTPTTSGASTAAASAPRATAATAKRDGRTTASSTASRNTRKTLEQQARDMEAAYKKETAARRKLQDAQLELEADGAEKERRQTELKYERKIEDLRHSLATEKNVTATMRESINAQIEAAEKEKADALDKLAREQQARELATLKETLELRLQAVKEGSAEEAELRGQLLDVQERQERLANAGRPAGERQEETDIAAAYAEKRAELASKQNAALEQQALEAYDRQAALAQSEFDLLETTEGQKTRYRLQAEKERLEKVLELNELYNGKLSAEEIATYRNQIDKLGKEIQASEKEERTGDIYGLLGLELSDEKKEAISESINYAYGALQEIAAARTEAANAAVEKADKEVEAAQNALNAEIEARNNGYANNVEMAQKELANAKANQQKALQEQAKAQRQQEAIDSLEQVSSLVTASAKIWKDLGFPFAIPAIAVMFASFAASKIMAAQYAKKAAGTETYGAGTVEYLHGGSHQSGNDIDLGTKPDGTRRRAEGGEFFAVINKRGSRRFRRHIPAVIGSLNDGTFAQKYLTAYDGGGLSVNVTRQDADLRELSSDVRRIREQGDRRTYIDADGRTVVVYKNLKRTIR